jgi:predicted AAA+ superfamily ATPase
MYLGGKKLKKERFSSLLKAGIALKCNNLAVITWDYESSERRNGRSIVYIPLWKWLLHG